MNVFLLAWGNNRRDIGHRWWIGEVHATHQHTDSRHMVEQANEIERERGIDGKLVKR
jgi:hypothetical protein